MNRGNNGKNGSEIAKLRKNVGNRKDSWRYVLFCTIMCIIFTSLCKNFVKLGDASRQSRREV